MTRGELRRRLEVELEKQSSAKVTKTEIVRIRKLAAKLAG